MILKIISADAVIFEGEISAVTLPGEIGAFTVLKNHASLVSTLTLGKIVYKSKDSSDEAHVEIEGGVADIDNNVVSVCLY